jgi:uncharacterized membrane protein
MAATKSCRYVLCRISEEASVNRRRYFLVTAVIFSVVGLVHLVRIVFELEAAIGGWSVPMWVSWLALAVSPVFAYYGFTHARSDR